MKRMCGGLAALMVAFGGVGGVRAADQGWTYTLTPYAWMAGLDGDVGVKGLVVPVDQSFSDILDNLDIALMLGAEAHNGTWGAFMDGMYMDLEADETTPVGKIEAGVQQAIVSAGGLYRVMADGNLAVDVGAGGRYIDTDLDVDTPVGSAGGSRDWADPILLARVQYQAAQRIVLALTGDIGGFGVESDLTWQVTGTAGYEFTDTVALLLGYRYLDYDYEDSRIVYDVAMSGLGLGLSLQF